MEVTGFIQRAFPDCWGYYGPCQGQHLTNAAIYERTGWSECNLHNGLWGHHGWIRRVLSPLCLDVPSVVGGIALRVLAGYKTRQLPTEVFADMPFGGY